MKKKRTKTKKTTPVELNEVQISSDPARRQGTAGDKSTINPKNPLVEQHHE